MPTTFNLKDVAVILTAAMTAAAPFFTYESKVTILETNQQAVSAEIDRIEPRLNELFQQIIVLNEKIRYMEIEQARSSEQQRQVIKNAVDAMKAELTYIEADVAILKAKLEQQRRTR